MTIRNEYEKATTLEELKAIYKRLAMKHHPDRGGNVETMKEVNALYDEYFEKLKTVHKNKDGEVYTKETNETAEYYKNIINELLKMEGVEIEIIGCFIWLSGNTKEHKEAIKELGFKWHSKKSMWYLAPKGYRKRYNKKHDYSIDEIRGMYGTSGKFHGQQENENAVVA